MTNLNLLFNKTYYSELGKGEPDFSQSLQRYNKQIFNTVFDHSRDYCPSPIASENDINDGKKGIFLLKTVYPGLLIGSGNPHGSNKSSDDIRLGFSFDYVSGQPYIPGSSVKGVLRSKFKQCPDAVAEIIEGILQVDLGDAGDTVKALEADIFDGKDVFLDAVVYDGESVNGRLMGADYITPHSSSIKSPNPILFVKVLPDVRFEFRFKLNDSEINGIIITAENKKKLFKELLKFFGAGAKTNVGYGVFEECDNAITEKSPLKQGTFNQCPAPQNNSHNSNSYSNSVKTKKCKFCGATIFEKFKDGRDNPGWRTEKCFNCKDKRG